MTFPRTNLGPEDMTIPEVKLVQNVGGEYAKEHLKAKPGDFHINLSDDIIAGETGFDIVVVAIQKTRTYWGRSEISDEPPECSSQDALSSMDGKECSACDKRCDTPWLVDTQERRDLCNLNYHILALDPDNSMPVLIRAGGISARAARELFTQLSLNRTLRNKENQIETYRALVQMTSEKKKTKSGEAFALHFRLKGLIDNAEKIQELQTQSAALLNIPLLIPEIAEPETTKPAISPSSSVSAEPTKKKEISAPARTGEARKIKETEEKEIAPNYEF